MQRLIPCTTKKSKNGKFCSVKEITLKDLYKPYANAVTATYFNHADSTDNSNLVIVIGDNNEDMDSK